MMQSNPATRPQRLLARMILGGIIMLTGVVMIAGFFLFPWIDFGEMTIFGLSAAELELSGAERAELEITAFEIWTGNNNGEDFTLKIDENASGGFADVRIMDRLLILVPLGGLLLMGLALDYANSGKGAWQLVMVAALMLAFPFIWQEMSTSDWKSELFMDIFFGNTLDETYSTSEQQIAGAVAFLVSLAALALEFSLTHTVVARE